MENDRGAPHAQSPIATSRMKSKTRPPDKPDNNAGANLFEIAFLALPFLSLIPNNFVPPPLGYEWLVRQEFYFAGAMAVFAGLGLWRIIKARGAALEIGREELLTLTTLALFILWQVISLVWAPTTYSGIRVTSVWLGLAIFFAAGLFSLRERSSGWLLYAISVVAVALAANVIIERFPFGDDTRGIFFN